jgi:hypothetical protein
MARQTDTEQTRAAEAEDPHPTPLSSYVGVGLMAFFAAMMLFVFQTASGSSLF